MKSARQLSFDVLLAVLHGGGYSNIAFDRAVRSTELSKRDAAFAAALTYGVLQREIELDDILAHYVRRGTASLEREVLCILRMGIYQILYMDSVPDRAAVDESVKLALYAHRAGAKGLINAVLRNFLRDGKVHSLPDEKSDPVRHYAVKYALPEWIFRLWSEQYGKEQAIVLAEESVKTPPLCIRVNRLKITAEALKARLEKEDVTVESAGLPDSFFVRGIGSLEQSAAFGEGLFYVQDLSSQRCVAALDARPGEVIYDLCAAPGSKSFTAAMSMENRGEIRAFDLHEHKIRIIEQGASRLGITIMRSGVRDALKHSGDLPKADAVLCDVPCSGLGVLRRKPEIRHKREEEIADLPELQLQILQNAASLVKEGGRLLYSTCTLNRRENEEVVRRFLQKNDEFLPLQSDGKQAIIENEEFFGKTLFPKEDGGDGFFYALLSRKTKD